MDHEPSAIDGVVVLDKATGITSAGAVEQVKRALGARRAGHGGTLDPIATGVLPVLLGEATKLAAYLLAEDKEYEAELVLGITTDTLDRSGAILERRDVAVTREAFEAAIRLGEQDQVPPMYSAIKQGGVRLHEHARAGVEVERAPRKIRIDRCDVIAWAPPRVTIAIACSKGTYVRSLVADLGAALGCGAYLAELRRTRSGIFAIADARKIDAIATAPVVRLAHATRLPTIALPRELEHRIVSGVQLPREAVGAPEHGQFQLVGEGDRLFAIAHVEHGKLVYDRVFRA